MSTCIYYLPSNFTRKQLASVQRRTSGSAFKVCCTGLPPYELGRLDSQSTAQVRIFREGQASEAPLRLRAAWRSMGEARAALTEALAIPAPEPSSCCRHLRTNCSGCESQDHTSSSAENSDFPKYFVDIQETSRSAIFIVYKGLALYLMQVVCSRYAVRLPCRPMYCNLPTVGRTGT